MQEYATLRAFVAVAHTGSVSKAAEQLHLTQPAVSLKLKQLQLHLGLTLFTRRPQGLTLTADGYALLPAAENALASALAFEQSASALHSTLRGKLRIGTIVDPEFIRLGDFLSRLMARAPQLETELHHSMSGSVLGNVEQGELDVGFFLAPPGEGTGNPTLAWRELTHFHYHVVAPRGWEAKLADTRWEALAQLPWIVTPHRVSALPATQASAGRKRRDPEPCCTGRPRSVYAGFSQSRRGPEPSARRASHGRTPRERLGGGGQRSPALRIKPDLAQRPRHRAHD